MCVGVRFVKRVYLEVDLRYALVAEPVRVILVGHVVHLHNKPPHQNCPVVMVFYSKGRIIKGERVRGVEKVLQTCYLCDGRTK